MLGTGIGVYIPIALYVGFWICVLASLLWNPRLGLYLAILLAPLQTVRERLVDYPMGTHLITVLVLSVLVGCLVRKQFIAQSPVNSVLLVLAAYLYLSLWVGVITLPNSVPFWLSDQRLSQWKDYMMLPLLFAATSMAVRTRKQAAMVMLFVVLSILLVYRSSVLELVLGHFSQYSEDKRPSGPMGYAGPNGLAAFLSQYTLLLIGLLFSNISKWKKSLLLVLVAGGSFVLLFSYSRGAYLAFLAGLFALAIVRCRKLIPVLLVFLVFWHVIVPQGVRDRIDMTYDQQGVLESSAASRLALWDFAMEKIKENPVFGMGHGTFQFMDNRTGLRDTHNWYVKVLFENGLIGMVIYCVLLFRFFQLATRLYREEHSNWQFLGLGLVLCLVSVVVANCFGDRWTYVEVNGALWVCLGLVPFLLSKRQECVENGQHEMKSEQVYRLAVR